MNKWTLPLVVMAVLVAGCVGQEPTTPAGGCVTNTVDGLSITCFSTAASELRSQQASTLMLDVENKGESTVGASYGAALLIIPTDWTLDKPAAQAYPKDLKNADPATGRPADIYQFRWRATAPVLPRGIPRTDTIIGRVYYDYTTKSNGVIPVYPYGEEVTDTASFTSSRGPVEISVSVSPNPPQIELAKEEFSLYIVLTNADTGQVYKNSTVTASNLNLADTQRNVVDLDITLPPGLEIKDKSCYRNIELIGGKATAICDVTVNKPAAKQLYPVSITAYYGYMIEAQTTITVTGR
ncbi:MAG: hypothetical protein QXU82_02120 [Candidatus Aenigmatarchaeota archaeon]